MALHVEMINSAEALERLAPEWNALLQDSPSDTVFLTWEWMSAWLESLSSSGCPCVLAARAGSNGRLVGLAPLFHRRVPRRLGPLRELTLMGAGPASGDHLDFIVRSGYERQVLDPFLRQISALGWDVLRLDGLRDTSPILGALRDVDPPPWMHVSTTACPFVELPRSWERLESALPRKMRYNLRSRARRLDADAGGEVEFHTVSRADEVERAMASLFELKRRAGAGPGRQDRFANRQRMRFHERVARRFLQEGWLRLHFLSVGGRPVAASYCFLYRGILSFFQTGFDPDWSRYGPGAAITAFSIREAIREGAREFDFLRGDESYKFQWAASARRVLKLRIGATVPGKIWVSSYGLARDARNRLFARSRRRRGSVAPPRVVVR